MEKYKLEQENSPQGNIKFSVLMSVYVKENPEYFKLALKSNISDQTLPPDEMVLICDGPLTEELDIVINEYVLKFPNILKVYRFESNQGLGRALNFGIEKCSYRYIFRSDSDDVCSPERFYKQMDFLIKNPEVDIVGSYIDEFDFDWKSPKNKKQIPTKHLDIVKMMKFRNPMNHMSVAFSKDSIIRAGSYIDLFYLEDYYLWVRALNINLKFANIPEYLVHARIGNGMIKRRGNKMLIKSWRELNIYMLEKKIINRFEYLRNVMAIRLFVFSPAKIKQLIYKIFLRNRS